MKKSYILGIIFSTLSGCNNSYINNDMGALNDSNPKCTTLPQGTVICKYSSIDKTKYSTEEIINAIRQFTPGDFGYCYYTRGNKELCNFPITKEMKPALEKIVSSPEDPEEKVIYSMEAEFIGGFNF